MAVNCEEKLSELHTDIPDDTIKGAKEMCLTCATSTCIFFSFLVQQWRGQHSLNSWRMTEIISSEQEYDIEKNPVQVQQDFFTPCHHT